MPDSSFEKYSPWVAGVINLIVSALGSYNAFFITPIAGLETPSIYVAIVGALAVTVFGFVLPQRAALILLGIFVLLFVPSIACYHQILSGAGATKLQLYFALFLYFFMYVVIFLVLAIIERFVIKYFST
jgi:hypothetical protein